MRKNRNKINLALDLKNLLLKDTGIAGGKGASLGEMTRAGIPVPPSFVILSTAFEKFLEQTDLNVEIDSILHSVNHKEVHTIDDALEKIKALILRADMPQDIATEIQKFFKKLNSKYVAVRSSATAEDSASAAWAGQLESYLNTKEENLLEEDISATDNSEFNINALANKYQLKLGVLRDMPLLTMSCIARGYGLMEKRFGVSYSVVSALGFDGKFHSLMSEAEIVDKMRELIKKVSPNVESKILNPANKILLDATKKLEEIEELVENRPSDFIFALIELYSDYFSCLGIYNCFWRYIGDGHDVNLTQGQIRLIGQYRDEAARFYPKPEQLLKIAVEKIGKQYGFDGDLIRYFFYSEVKGKNNLIPTSDEKRELQQRRKKYFYLFLQSSHEERVITDRRIIKHIEKKYYSVDDKNADILKGSPAFSGRVRGEVVNLMEKKQSKIPADMILVTSMTHPDDVPMIKKSKAIITDEGGILSHAAITARELKVPCVVGTKFATKILKSGMFIEVDADAGTVKILERN